MDHQLVAALAEIFSAYARIEGMRAQNQHRASCGESPAYDEAHFDQEANHLQNIANGLLRQ